MNTRFLEFFLYGIWVRCRIYSYTNAKYCLSLHTRCLFEIYLQINSTDAIGTKLNFFHAQSLGIQTVLVTINLLLVLFPTNFCTILLFSKSLPLFSNLFLSFQISFFQIKS